MSINKVILIGNVGQDPEIRQTQTGQELANFSLATSENWKDKSGEKKEKTEWHNIIVFGNLVSVVKNYIKKGTKLYIEGQLETQKYEKDGKTNYTTKIVVKGFNSTLQILSSKDDKKEVVEENSEEGNFSDEIPF